MYATGTKDFVTAIDEKHIILVKSLQSTDDYPQVEQIAKELVTTLNMEAMVSVRANIWNNCRGVKGCIQII